MAMNLGRDTAVPHERIKTGEERTYIERGMTMSLGRETAVPHESKLDEDTYSCSGPDEEFVESMAQQAAKLLKGEKTVSVHVKGWSGIGRRRVMDHVVAVIAKCEDFSGCIRVAVNPSIEAGFVEYEIRSKMEQLVQRPLWAHSDNESFWRDVGRSLNWKPIVLILDELNPGFDPTALAIPKQVYQEKQGKEAILLKLVFTLSSDRGDTVGLGYPVGVDEEKYQNLPNDVAFHMLIYEARSAAMTTKTESLPRLKEKLNVTMEKMTSMELSSLVLPRFIHPPDIDNLRGETIIHFLFYCRLFPQLEDPLDYLRSEDFHFNCFDPSENSWNATLLFTSLLQDLRQRCLIEEYCPRKIPEILGVRLCLSLPRHLEEQLAAALATSSSSALTIIRQAQGYLVRHSKGLDQIDMAEWTQDLTKISFANNRVKQILLPPPPSLLDFPNLSTLILQKNKTLEEIPNDVFHYMPNLRVLDLSNCRNMTILPSSLSRLANLRMLSLRECGKLQTIDMSGLDNLEVLNLCYCPLYKLENALWGHMHNLKHLNFSGYALRSLQQLELSVKSVKIFDAFDQDIRDAFPYASSVQKFKVVILYPNEDQEAIERRRTRDAHFQTGQFPYKHLHARAQANPLSTFPHPGVSGVVENPHNKYLEINGGEGLWSLYTLIVIVRPHRLSLHNYQNAREGIWSFPELRECDINCCNDMEFAFNFHGNDWKRIWMLKNLQTLWISSLAKLHAICSDRFEQLESFRLLKSIYLNYCPSLVALFSMSVCLPSLEVMEVRFCARLEKLFRHHTTGEIVLPRLKRLHLCGLPKLTSICDEGHLPLLERLEVRGCWNLNSVPFPSFDPHSNVPARVVVRGEAEWWKNVQGCNKDRIDFGIGSISATPKHIPHRLNRGGRWHSINKEKAGHHRRR